MKLKSIAKRALDLALYVGVGVSVWLDESDFPDAEGVDALVVYLYRLPDGTTQVMAPGIHDTDLVVDILEMGISAMEEGQPIQRQ